MKSVLDWGVCCELSPQWPWTASHMGPPGGFNAQMDGWEVNGKRLFVAFDKQYSEKFFRGNNDISNGDKRWIDWFGSLNEGILNYMCLSYDQAQYEYCTSKGQPLAPAANQDEEIYPKVKNPPAWFNKFKGV